MAIQKTEAIVLRRIDFRETSLIADFYSRDFGKVSGILKGIRTDPRKFASNIELFSHNEIIFYQKRNSSLHLVSHADKKNNFDPIRLNIVKSTMASYMMELLNAVMPHEDTNSEVFDLTLGCLQELAATDNPDKIGTIFKIKMLVLSGFKPHFDSCISCGKQLYEQSKFSLMLGGLLCAQCWPKDLASRSIFRGTVATILHIERNSMKNSLNLGMNPQIKKELAIILNAFLNFHLEKELKSQRVLSAVV